MLLSYAPLSQPSLCGCSAVTWVLGGVGMLWVIQSFFALWKTIRARKLYAGCPKQPQKHDALRPPPRVALIIAAKGASPQFSGFVDFVLNQNYKNYRIIFATESTGDPAYKFLEERLKRPTPVDVTLVVSQRSKYGVQKVQNQLAAFAKLEPTDEIIAFADCDFSADLNWLSLLVEPLHRKQCDFTTTCRWFIPANQNLPNQIVSIIGAAIEPWMGPSWRMGLWGGSMFMTREAFDSLDIPGNFQESLHDDVRVTRLAFEAGKKIRYVRAIAAVSPVNFTWRSFLIFGRRQYVHLSEHKTLWWMAFFTPLCYLLSFASCLYLLMSGSLWALCLVIAGLIFNLLRTRVRLSYLRERFPNGEAASLEKTVRRSWFMDPIVNLFHFIVVFSSIFRREIVWAGIRYRLLDGYRAEVLHRPEND